MSQDCYIKNLKLCLLKPNTINGNNKGLILSPHFKHTPIKFRGIKNSNSMRHIFQGTSVRSNRISHNSKIRLSPWRCINIKPFFSRCNSVKPTYSMKYVPLSKKEFKDNDEILEYPPISKEEVKAALEKCKDLMVEKKPPLNLFIYKKNNFDETIDSYIMTPSQVSTKIQDKFCDDLNRLRKIKFTELRKEIENIQKKKLKPNSDKDFTFLELLEQELKCNKKNSEDRHEILKEPNLLYENDKPENNEMNNLKGKLNQMICKEFTNCFTEIDSIVHQV